MWQEVFDSEEGLCSFFFLWKVFATKSCELFLPKKWKACKKWQCSLLLYQKHNKLNCDMKTKVNFVNHSTLCVSVKKNRDWHWGETVSLHIHTLHSCCHYHCINVAFWLVLSDSIVIVKIWSVSAATALLFWMEIYPSLHENRQTDCPKLLWWRVSWAEWQSSQFQSVCVPTLIYGHKLWVVTEIMSLWIQVAFKGCLGLSPWDKVRRLDICRPFKVFWILNIEGASWGCSGILSQCHLGAFHLRFSGHILLGGDHGADPEHAGEIICLIWPGNTSRCPCSSCRTWLGRGTSGLPYRTTAWLQLSSWK